MLYPIDTSNEMQFQRWRGGLMLVKPGSRETIIPSMALQEVFNLPFDVYLYDTAHQYKKINDEFIRTGNLVSSQEVIGKTASQLFPKQSDAMMRSNLSVMKCGRTQMNDLEFIYPEKTKSYLSIKTPLYNEKNKIIGVLGCAFLLGVHALSHSFEQVSKLGILNAIRFNHRHDYSFTFQERNCLYLLGRGKTNKEIAAELDLSTRTVEAYIVTLKSKLQVFSKSELIDVARDFYV